MTKLFGWVISLLIFSLSNSQGHQPALVRSLTNKTGWPVSQGIMYVHVYTIRMESFDPFHLPFTKSIKDKLDNQLKDS